MQDKAFTYKPSTSTRIQKNIGSLIRRYPNASKGAVFCVSGSVFMATAGILVATGTDAAILSASAAAGLAGGAFLAAIGINHAAKIALDYSDKKAGRKTATYSNERFMAANSFFGLSLSTCFLISGSLFAASGTGTATQVAIAATGLAASGCFFAANIARSTIGPFQLINRINQKFHSSAATTQEGQAVTIANKPPAPVFPKAQAKVNSFLGKAKKYAPDFILASGAFLTANGLLKLSNNPESSSAALFTAGGLITIALGAVNKSLAAPLDAKANILSSIGKIKGLLERNNIGEISDAVKFDENKSRFIAKENNPDYIKIANQMNHITRRVYLYGESNALGALKQEEGKNVVSHAIDLTKKEFTGADAAIIDKATTSLQNEDLKWTSRVMQSFIRSKQSSLPDGQRRQSSIAI